LSHQQMSSEQESKSQTQKQPHIYSVDSETVRHSGKWLQFVERRYRHRDGHEIVYESVHRQTQRSGQAAAVIVVPRFGDSLVLVKQYRAPVDAWVLEFPAGLTDPGESAEAAALRELAEETGFSGSVVGQVSPRCAAECSISSADEVFVSVACQSRGAQASEADEDIEVVLVPAKQLLQTLDSMAREGCLICSRLQAFAVGLAFNT
ncbi:hypothetical protein BOX15_Mlig027581g2, partial [Macrostomum lignano]